jgi:predicted acetyltransferase
VRTLRPVTAEELPAVLGLMMLAFRAEASPAARAEARAASMDPSHTLGVFEDGRPVATARSEPLPLTVPGGRLPAAGVSQVAVLPTHRRQGILREIVRRQLDDARAAGQAVAVLFASEGAIYGRYGFGVATYEAHVRVARRRNAFRTPASVAGLRLAGFAEAVDEMLAIVDRVVPSVPGALRRPDGWWRHAAASPPPGGVPWEVVLRAEGDGFVAYDRALDFAIPSLDGGSLRVHWLFAETPEAHAALWRYCLDVDLMDEVTAWARPVDEPLRHLLADPRGLESSVWDALWLRLVDAEAALGGRTYGPGEPVRLSVEDELCPWNAGTYEVSSEAGCRRVSAAPDLVLPTDGLAACYLGGNRFTTLARAGRVEERRPGAAERADRLFAAPRAPWCPFHF